MFKHKAWAAILAAGILIFSGCSDRSQTSAGIQQPDPQPEETGEQLPAEEPDDTPPFIEDEAFYQEVLITYGGERRTSEQGEDRIEPTAISLFYWTEGWSEEAPMEPMDYYNWYFSMVQKEPLEERERKYDWGTDDFGFPQELYEPLVQSYFDVSTETLRSDPNLYHPQEGRYWLDGAGGRGEQPPILLNETEREGELRHLHYELLFKYQEKIKGVLTIRLAEDGSYQFISCLPEEG